MKTISNNDLMHISAGGCAGSIGASVGVTTGALVGILCLATGGVGFLIAAGAATLFAGVDCYRSGWQ